MREDLLKQYAEFAVKVGVNPQKGQTMLISCSVESAPFARLCAQAAFEAGARDVVMKYTDEQIARIRMENASVETLEDVKPYILRSYLDYAESEGGVCTLNIHADDPEAFKGLDAGKLNRVNLARRAALEPWRAYTMNDRVQWCVVAIPTPAGTGTEADPYAVVTNEETNEKLDFTLDEIFPAISIIDPELMLTLPHKLTLFQGFDALFHASECYVNNGNENRLTELFAVDAIEKVAKHLPIVSEDGSNLESRSNISYAANILCGFTQSLVCTTSHHIIAQALGGFFPNVPHGASLLLIADAYYKKVCSLLPTEFDAIGEIMGEKADPAKPGYAFVTALAKLMERTGMDKLAMSDFNINKDDLPKVAHIAAAEVGFECDRYTVTEADVVEILMQSYK